MLYPQQTKVLAEKYRAWTDEPYRADIYAEVQRLNSWIRQRYETRPGVIPMLNVADGYFDAITRAGVRVVVFVPFPAAPKLHLGGRGLKKYIRGHVNEAVAQVDQMALLLEVCARVEFIQLEQKRIADTLDDLRADLQRIVK